jgi:Ca2+/Na+ antiporter
MILMGFIVLIFIRTKWSIRRWEGAFLVALYLGFMAFLFLNPQ